MKQPKKSTKILFVIISAFLVFGIACGTVGLLSGVSNWFVFDGSLVKTSNMVKPINSSQILEEFTSVDIKCPFEVIEIVNGDNFSVSFNSRDYSVEPEISVVNGTLVATNKKESNRDGLHWKYVRDYDKYGKDNIIKITVPAETVLEYVSIDKTSKNSVDQLTYDSIKISNLKIKNLAVNRSANINHIGANEITNCSIDRMTYTNVTNCSVSDSNIGDMIIENNDDMFWMQQNQFALSNSTVNFFKTIYGGNRSDEIEMKINLYLDKSKLLSTDATCYDFGAKNSEISNSNISANGISVANSVVIGENNFRAGGKISVNLAQPSNDLNCELLRATEAEGLITEIVDFDDPRYAFGYVTDEIKSMGKRDILVTDTDFYDITNHGNDYYGSSSSTAVENFSANHTDREGSKFDQYIEARYQSEEEQDEEGYYITVYKKKAITYSVNVDGYTSYLDLRNKMNDNQFLSIGTEKTFSEIRKNKPANSKNSLKCYSIGGYVSVDFTK